MSAESNRYSTGANLRAERARSALTQREVAAALGVSKNTYARYEADRTSPSVEQLQLLGAVFGVSPQSLLPVTADSQRSAALAA